MPELTEDQIKAAIAEGKVGGLTLDTNIFDRYGCHLDFKVFAALRHFKGAAIGVLLSEIVHNEVARHIAAAAAETQRALKTAIKDQAKRWKTLGDLSETHKKLGIEDPPADLAQTQLKAFIAEIGAVVVPAVHDPDLANEVIRRYFAPEPPFETKEKKKSEFPDAFALLSLEAHAKKAGKLTLCVSDDGGWQTFCAQSEHLVCVPGLDTVLSYFFTPEHTIAAEVLARWRAGKAEDLDRDVDSAFAYALDGFDFYPDADMPTNFEATPLSAVVQSIDLANATSPSVIASTDDDVTFTTKVDALIAFEAEFRAFVRDEGEVPLGTVTETKEETVTCELIVTVAKDLDPEPTPIGADVRLPQLAVHFGYVHPFRDEDPTYEKY